MNFKLQPYSGPQSRYTCPQCNHRNKTFVRYIDMLTGNQMAPHVGRCNREDQCGYHFKPGRYFAEQSKVSRVGYPNYRYSIAPQVVPIDLQTDYMPAHLVNKSFGDYDDNNFVKFLQKRFGIIIAKQLVQRYRIGTSSYWPGASVFWQLDADGHVRTGKVMLYNPETGKRVREPYNCISWAHKIMSKQLGYQTGDIENYNLKQCLFGEHLLAEDLLKPIGIVESEKTAIMASQVIKEFIWLACGSLNGLSTEKCKVLQGRKVMLFPDVNGYDKWRLKALQLKMTIPGTIFLVSNTLENAATEQDRLQGADIGDLVGW